MSTEPTWRVYLSEWLTVYTSDCNGDRGEEECRRYFTQRYGGRVRAEDWGIRVADPMFPDDSVRWLLVCLPNLKGEFQDYGDALAMVGVLMDDTHPDSESEIVQRGSDEEQELLAYGKKKLPDVR